MLDGCPFCEPDEERVWLDDEIGLVLWDAYPVSDGHTLVLPRRHVASTFELSPDEHAALWQLVFKVRQRVLEEFQPDGFNIGVNDGAAAGQTVIHAHKSVG